MNTPNYFFDDYNNMDHNRQITYNNYMRFASSTNHTLNNILAVIQNQQTTYHYIVRTIGESRQSIPRSVGRVPPTPTPIRSIWNRAPGPTFSRLPRNQYIDSSNIRSPSIDILIG